MVLAALLALAVATPTTAPALTRTATTAVRCEGPSITTPLEARLCGALAIAVDRRRAAEDRALAAKDRAEAAEARALALEVELGDTQAQLAALRAVTPAACVSEDRPLFVDLLSHAAAVAAGVGACVLVQQLHPGGSP